MPDDLTIRDKGTYVAAYADKTRKGVPTPNWTNRQKIALACRIPAEHGHACGLAGQVTIRGEQPGTFWIHDYRYGIEEVRARDVLLINEEMEVLDGEGMANPGARFHAWIYRKRPDVNAICHTHSLYASALSMLEIPLIPSLIDTVGLHEEVGHLKKWPGIPFGDGEGQLISEALGDRRCVFLGHHGPLTACSTLEEACVLIIAMERAAHLQTIAQPLGPIQPLDHDKAMEGKRLKQTPGSYLTWFAHYARIAARADGDCLL